MLSVLAHGLAAILDLLLVYLGLTFLFAPWKAATGYGIPATRDRAYLTVKGLRDGTYGFVGLALLIFGGPLAAAWFMLVGALVPAGDMIIVRHNGGTRAVAFGIHGVTAMVFVISATLLFAVGR